MISTVNFIDELKRNSIDFFTGVPDSVLKKLSNKFEKFDKNKHVLAFNEGSAIALGIGYHLATNKIPCIYLQNAGLGNAINPLVSIAHKNVYSIPLLMVIGWRGSPNRKKDEPQHNVKGKITRKLLSTLGIKNIVIKNKKDLLKLRKLIKFSKQKKIPVACLIEQNSLVEKNKPSIKLKSNFGSNIERSDVIYELLHSIKNDTKIVSTTGYTSRELNQIRREKKLGRGKDFYMVGGMGHSSMVALGLSLKLKKQIICLDGDGSLLMHMGSLRSAGIFAKKNFKHILLNNAVHESVGEQRTFSENLDFLKLVKKLGYRNSYKTSKKNKLKKIINIFLKSKGPSFLEIKIKTGTIKNLTRPKNLKNNKFNFQK